MNPARVTGLYLLAVTLITSQAASAFDEVHLHRLILDNECVGCDLTDSDLSDRDFTGANVAGSDLTGANLSGSVWDGATMTGTTLVNVDASPFEVAPDVFQPTSFINANLEDTDVTGADLSSAVFTRARIGGLFSQEDTNFRAAQLNRVGGLGVIIRRSDLRAVNAVGAALPGVDLSGCDLYSANFTGAVLRNAIVELTRIEETSFFAAELMNVSFFVTDFISAVFTEADLRHANLSGRNLVGYDLYGCDLREANLHDTMLHGADLSSAKLDGQNFDQSLRGTIFDDASLKDVDFTGATMRGSSLRNTDLTTVTFPEIPLYEVDLTDAQCPGCEFHGVDFSNSTLDGMQLQGANFDGVELRGCSFDGADLTGASFVDAVLTTVQLWYEESLEIAGYDRNTFHGATMIDVDASGASLQGAEFHGAQLQGFVCEGCSEGADFTGADLTGATLTDMDFSVYFWLILDGATATGLALDGSRIERFSAVSANLEDASFSGVEAHHGSVDGANLFGSGFDDLDYTRFGFCDTIMPEGESYSMWPYLMVDFLADFPEPETCAEAPMGDGYASFLKSEETGADRLADRGRGTRPGGVAALPGATDWEGDGRAPSSEEQAESHSKEAGR